MSSSETQQAHGLLNAAAVRERAHEMLEIGVAGGLDHWRVDLDRLPETASYVAAVIRDQYPTLAVPFHARWRHFAVDGVDLWGPAAEDRDWLDPASRARAEFDLAIVSVLLDAGAGPGWSYKDKQTGKTLSRSEGLAIASLRMFEAGAFSVTEDDPWRVDAVALTFVTADALAKGFQVTADNPLVGLDGRAALLRRLGQACLAKPDLFALEDEPRPGGLFDAMVDRADDQDRLPAPVILEVLLEALGPVWRDRLTLGGVDLGDCWKHPAMKRGDATNGLVPIHKLSQWLSYSLVEPLRTAGVQITDLDGLTGLAEYRNGGLFMDLGVLTLKDPAGAAKPWPVSDPLVVGWRAMTVALLDRIAPLVRAELGVTAADMPLASVLEGGTWAAGRRAAAERRQGGGPPLTILSDGTVF
ncbi:URC4/urg3 family protein [Brevundimonas sp. Root1423]|uniref:URC4/urg3 family protein n=1 Tax=Brevundimonas sp. Root1423 TaxID=1736462 RepID=UPI0006FC71E9|nr:URC4/urg3 family protein [Brevundimonas sp. Root1423]KQY84782.1 uracil phosphoribosyltransferase [Brevundimonas sp. Root1423]